MFLLRNEAGTWPRRIIGCLNTTEHGKAFQHKWRLWGYVLVGSKSLLGYCDQDQDTDAVLLSKASFLIFFFVSKLSLTPFHRHSDGALAELAQILRKDKVLGEAVIWFVQATVNVVKVQNVDDSVDLLWLPGVTYTNRSGPPHQPPMNESTENILEYKADDPAFILPLYGGLAVESIHLSRIFLRTLHARIDRGSIHG